MSAIFINFRYKPDTSLADVFSHSVGGFLFCFVDSLLCCAISCSFHILPYVCFFFCFLCSRRYVRKKYCWKMCLRFYCLFSSMCFILLFGFYGFCLTFGFLVFCLFYIVQRGGLVSFFWMFLSNFPSTIYQILFLSHYIFLPLLLHINWSYRRWPTFLINIL